jgi:hypothetical protein
VRPSFRSSEAAVVWLQDESAELPAGGSAGRGLEPRDLPDPRQGALSDNRHAPARSRAEPRSLRQAQGWLGHGELTWRSLLPA